MTFTTKLSIIIHCCNKYLLSSLLPCFISISYEAYKMGIINNVPPSNKKWYDSTSKIFSATKFSFSLFIRPSVGMLKMSQRTNFTNIFMTALWRRFTNEPFRWKREHFQTENKTFTLRNKSLFPFPFNLRPVAAYLNSLQHFEVNKSHLTAM